MNGEIVLDKESKKKIEKIAKLALKRSSENGYSRMSLPAPKLERSIFSKICVRIRRSI